MLMLMLGQGELHCCHADDIRDYAFNLLKPPNFDIQI